MTRREAYCIENGYKTRAAAKRAATRRDYSNSRLEGWDYEIIKLGNGRWQWAAGPKFDEPVAHKPELSDV